MKKFLDDEAFHAELTNLFLSEGMRALTVGSIAARLRCSRRRLYELAQTKEELFCQVTQRHFDTALAAGDAVLEHAQGDLAEILTQYLWVGAKAGAQLSTPFLEDLEAFPEAKKIFDNYQNLRVAHAQGLIEQGIRQGIFVPCHTLLVIEALRSAGQRLRHPDFLTQAGLTMDQAFEEFYRIFLGGLLAQRPAGAAKEQQTRRQPAKASQQVQ